MDRRRPAPAFLPAAALLAGATLAFRLSSLSVPLAVTLAVLAFTLGRPWARLVGWLAVGLLLPPVRGALPGAREAFEADRPVAVVGRVSGHWRRGEGFWWAPLAVERLRQGGWVGFHPREIFLSLPGEEAPPSLGSRLRLKGYLRQGEGYWNRLPTPPGPWRLRVKSRRLLTVEEPPAGVSALSGRLRQRLETQLSSPGPEGPGRALIRALLLGDAGVLPPAWRRGLRRCGLSHLLAVSGLHVGLVAAVVLLAAGRLPRPLRLGLSLAAIAFYLLLVGPRPSLLRASLMAALAVLALLADRPPSSANSLAWAAVVLVAHRPAAVVDLGFQLTVAATAGLVLLAPRLEERWRRLPGPLRRPLAASAAAQVAVLPWALPVFHLATPVAVLANLVAVPWVALCLVAILSWSALGLVAPSAAAAAVALFDPLAAPLGWPAAVRATVPLALPVAVSAPVAALVALLLALLLLRPRWAPALALPLLLPLYCRPERAEEPVELLMLDVGQGDAFLLADGDRALLVDGGGWERGDFGGAVLLPALAAEGVRSLDAVVLTHPDRDHCGGLLDLVDYLPVAEVWTPANLPASGCGGALARLPGVGRRVLWAGEEARLGRWRFLALHPRAGDGRRGNEGSLVLVAEAHGRRVLLTGDVGAPSERRLLRGSPELLACDVLKVGHHGSRHSSTRAFLAAAAPTLALISAGRHNLYHHPAAETLERLERQGVRVLRSDREGLVQVVIHPGGAIRVHLPGRRPDARKP